MLGIKRLGSLVILLAVAALVLSAGSAIAAAFAAKASVAPQVQFLGDTSGTVFTFTIHNTGTSSSIGAVEIDRPTNSWTVVGCPMAPAGWSIQSSATMCRYRSQNGNADDIQPGSSSSSFKLKANTLGGQANRTGAFKVIVSKSNQFDNPSLLTAAAAEPPGLTVTVYSWEILDAVVQAGPATPGNPCPAPTAANHSAVTGSTSHTIVICGKNRTNSTLTPVASQATLGGTFIAGHGGFSSGPIGPRSASSVVLGNWDNVSIINSAGPGKTVVAKVGSAPTQTSPVTTLDDDCLGISGWCVVNGGYEALNRPPDAVDDLANANEDGPAISIDVMANDSDPEGDPIHILSTGGSPIGLVSITGSGSTAQISYDPNGQFESLGVGQTDTDGFTYTISDPFGATDTADVTVTIHGQNDPPLAIDDTGTTDEDTLLIVPAAGLLANDTDVDSGDTKVVSAVNGSGANVGATIALPSGALLSVNADGSYAYDPNGQFDYLQAGSSAGDSFTYTMMDSQGATSSATVSITVNGVNDSPVANPDHFITNEDAAILGPNVLANDIDPDFSDVLSVSAVNGSPADVGIQITLASGALLTLNANGSLSYDPNGQFEYLQVGDTFVDSFTYTVADGHGGASSSFDTITVSGVNDPPTAEDGDCANLQDPEGDTLVVVAVNGDAGAVGNQITLPSGALVTVNSDGSYTYDPNGQFTYLGAGEMATDTFTLTVSDGHGGSVSCAVTVTITGVNDPPNAINDHFITDEDTAILGPNVLVNDTDPDLSDVLSVSAVNGNPADVGNQITLASGALLTLNADGSLSYDPNGKFEYLQVGDTATDTFTYTVSDLHGATSTATVSISINGVNDPPVAVNDTGTTDESTILVAAAPGILANDSDPDLGDTLSVTAVNGSPANVGATIALASGALLSVNVDGSYAYDPNGQFESLNNGDTATDTFTYADADSFGAPSNTATVTITITGITNHPPVAVDDNYSVDEDGSLTADGAGGNPAGVLANDSDPDAGDTMTAVLTSGVTHGTLVLNADGTFTYSPDANYNGSDTFKYKAQDNHGALSSEATVTITVNPVNDAPSFTSGGNVSVAEDSGTYSAAWATAVSAGPPDEAGQALDFIIQSNSNASLFSVAPSIASDGTLSFTPEANANGTATIAVVLQDNGGTLGGGQDTSAPVSFNITVTAVNDAPVNTVPGDPSVNEDTDLVFSSGNGNALSVADVDAGGANIQVTVSALNGTITPAGGSGAVVSGSGTGSTVITGTVLQANAALNGLKYKGNLNFNDTRGSETLTLATDDLGNTGSGGALTDIDTVGITVNAVNDPPTAAVKSYSAQANMKITGLTGLLSGATDPDTGDGGYSATFTVGTTGATTPSGGTISNLNTAVGSFDFDPPPGATGAVTFTYTVCDSGNPGPSMCSAPATVTVNVASPAIWFVDPSAGVNGDGRLSSPFNNLASAATVDASGQRIFVYSGTATSGITLNTDEWLIGQGVTGASFDAVFSITPPAGTIARPSINGARPTIQGNVAMATSDAVRGLNIQPSSGTQGLTASGATSLVAGEASVTTANAVAVSLTNSDGTFSFTSISASGGANGIVWNNASPATGSFTVNGDGSNTTPGGNGSGGTISNMSGSDGTTAGIGVYLTNAHNVTLRRMTINGTNQNFGIHGISVTNFTLEYATVGGTNGTSAPNREGSVIFDNLFGTDAIASSIVSGSIEDNVRVENTTGTLTAFNLTNSTIQNNSIVSGNVGLRFATATSGVSMTGTVSGTTFQGNRTIAIQADASNGTVNFTATNNTIIAGTGGNNQGNQGIEVDVANNGVMTFAVEGNKIGTDGITNQPLLNTGINIFNGTLVTSGTPAATTGTVKNNTVYNAGAGQSGFGIRLFNQGYGTMNANVSGNTVNNVGLDYGIFAEVSSNSGTANATGSSSIAMTGNTSNVLSGALDAIRLQARGRSTMCARVSGNASTTTGTGFFGLEIRQAAQTVPAVGGTTYQATFNLEGLTNGLQTDHTTIVNYLVGQNPAVSDGVDEIHSAGITGVAATSCSSIP